MLRVICIVVFLGGCWLPPHIPQPIPSAEATPALLEETRNVCTDLTPDVLVLREDSERD